MLLLFHTCLLDSWPPLLLPGETTDDDVAAVGPPPFLSCSDTVDAGTAAGTSLVTGADCCVSGGGLCLRTNKQHREICFL